MFANKREYGKCRVPRLVHSSKHPAERSVEPSERCRHRLLNVVPVVSVRVEDGYAARCLLCGTTGPVRGSGEAARRVLFKQLVRNA